MQIVKNTRMPKFDWIGSEHNLQVACAQFSEQFLHPDVFWTSVDQMAELTEAIKQARAS